MNSEQGQEQSVNAEKQAWPPGLQRLAHSPKCLSIDLEIHAASNRLLQFAGVRGDQSSSCLHQDKSSVEQALGDLDKLAEGCDFVLGHNLIAFDFPHLRALGKTPQVLKLPVVDTLRLNPLAFPKNPYHHLVKHYQSGQLYSNRMNNPELDARLTLEVFSNQIAALWHFQQAQPELLTAWHWLTTVKPASATVEPNQHTQQTKGWDQVFSTLRNASRPEDSLARAATYSLCQGKVCQPTLSQLLDKLDKQPWETAYALAWLHVAGGKSVVPPWVRHQFPGTSELIQRLRDKSCGQADCEWCSTHHNAEKVLHHLFGFKSFRPEPAEPQSGQPLQKIIVQEAMNGEHLLGILPTGTGKSVCYQIPALSRFENTGALTVVISPLVALMEDQVKGLRDRFGIESCGAINGLLSMPERGELLDKVRLGEIGILIISPEQLRSRTVRSVLAQREIGAWVMDEAHCLSKWGQDFRPDYRYVGRFIKESQTIGDTPPILCLTATAKPEVVSEIQGHFHNRLGATLKVYDGGANRDNLQFQVIPTTSSERLTHVQQVLQQYLPADGRGGAIVYCSTRKRTEEVATFLQGQKIAAGFFHAGMSPEAKKKTQKQFIDGDLRVIAATNAFGMGIDKPDVRLVLHAELPGSLENYLQEAGRAGRDRESAQCVLLYNEEDVDKQFRLSAFSRLKINEIQAVLRAIRRLDRGKDKSGEIVATTGEILLEEDGGDFRRDSTTDDTRLRTAISWLEEATLLKRDENLVQIFPSSLRINSLEEAEKKLQRVSNPTAREQLLKLVEAILGCDASEGVTSDELCAATGLTNVKLRNALRDLEEMGVVSNDTQLTAYVHVGVENHSRKRLRTCSDIERALLGIMREQAPDLGKGDQEHLHLRQMSQALRDQGHAKATPELVGLLLKGLSEDGKAEDEAGQNNQGEEGSIKVERVDIETRKITLQRSWSVIEQMAERRRQAASLILAHWLSTLPEGARGNDLLAESTMGALQESLRGDALLVAQSTDLRRLMDRALLWAHECEIFRLNKGLAIFRSAMTLRLSPGHRKFSKSDFQDLESHYQEQTLQIHVMAEYVKRGLARMADALRLTLDYFTKPRGEFLARWLPGREKELTQQTTPQSFQRIVEDLNNPVQRAIVTDNREQTSVLVLAGPGSGKTRVLVHRIAFLVRVRRERPGSVLALCYNRHAATEIRRRLFDLIGDDAIGVTVLTCHSLAMRLAGISFAERFDRKSETSQAAGTSDSETQQQLFEEALKTATELLQGSGLSPDEADAQRERLLRGFRWILVDEYQDIGEGQYQLISALAGRQQQDKDQKLTLFAVGDDDQNIYAYAGASVKYIRQYSEDYQARESYLTENYRSTRAIIECANAVIEGAANRMKSQAPIQINDARREDPPGGELTQLDAVSQGRVQLFEGLQNPAHQAVAVVEEFRRLGTCLPDFDWKQCAVIARDWKTLEPLRSYCESENIPVQVAKEADLPFWRLRETRQLVDWLQTSKEPMPLEQLQDWVQRRQALEPQNDHWRLLQQAAGHYRCELPDTGILQPPQFIEWLSEWGQELRHRQQGLLLLTAHRAKGLEFDHVAVLGGPWQRVGRNEDPDAPRRLYYVAMTRAKYSLSLWQLQGNEPPWQANLRRCPHLINRGTPQDYKKPELTRQYLSVSLREIDLGYAGRKGPTQNIHQYLQALQIGDSLQVPSEDDAWLIRTQSGEVVGKLAKKFQLPKGYQIAEARVEAIVIYRRRDSAPEYQDSCQCEQWEVVVPELILEPTSLNLRH